MLLKNKQVSENQRGTTYLKRNENENTTYKNLWDVAKQFLRGSSRRYRTTQAKLKK